MVNSCLHFSSTAFWDLNSLAMLMTCRPSRTMLVAIRLWQRIYQTVDGVFLLQRLVSLLMCL